MASESRAAGLAALGARVVAGRDQGPGRAAAAGMAAAATGNPAVDAFAADMSSQAEVRRLAREVLAAVARACTYWSTMWAGSGAPAGSPQTGWSTPSPSTTSRRFLLTDLLLDRLKASAPRPGSWQRIGSHARDRQGSNFDDLQNTAATRAARLQPVEAGQRPVHVRPPAVSTAPDDATVLHPGAARTGYAVTIPRGCGWPCFR